MPAAETFEQSFPLYACPGHLDPAHDAVPLATGFQGDGDVDLLLGKKTSVPGLGESGLVGRLIRNGDWAWVTWSAVGGVDPFVAADGLTDKQVIAARGAHGGRPAREQRTDDREVRAAVGLRAGRVACPSGPTTGRRPPSR